MTTPCTCGVLTELSLLIHVRLNDGGTKSLPVVGLQLADVADNLETVERLAVYIAMNGLDLQEGIFLIEFDRNVGPSEPDIGESGPNQWSVSTIPS